MVYYVKNGVHIIEVPVSDFSIVLCDKRKKTAQKSNYVNAGFFGTFKEGGSTFTLPSAHVVCDFDSENRYTKHYCSERGEFVSGKFIFDTGRWSGSEFFEKPVSTLLISNGEARIDDVRCLPAGLDYAIAGVPVIKNWKDVKFKTYVTQQGWDSSSLRATWHVFLGLKDDAKTVYIMGLKTKTSNLIYSAEAYKIFSSMGFKDVIKLDGGGSFYMNVNGKAVATTLENRLINTIICFTASSEQELDKDTKNPYPAPTLPLSYGNRWVDHNKWLQWQLNYHGFKCNVDGSFGPATKKQVLAFQKSRGLDPDASVGPATRAALLDTRGGART